MNKIQVVKDKRERIALVDEDDKVLGELVFNPDDTSLYKKILQIFKVIQDGAKVEKQISAQMEELSKLPDELDDVDDFDRVSQIIDAACDGVTKVDDMAQAVYDGINDALGNGKDVCAIITGGDNDLTLLIPVLETVMSYFEKSRDAKTGKYLA